MLQGRIPLSSFVSLYKTSLAGDGEDTLPPLFTISMSEWLSQSVLDDIDVCYVHDLVKEFESQLCNIDNSA